jgi:hypothetical protein
MSHFVEVPVNGQQTLVVEVDEPSEGSVVRAGRFRDVTATAVQTLDSAADGIKSAAGAFVTKMRSLEQTPKEIAIEFGVQLATEAGVVIASTSAQANVKVTVRWTRE